MYFDSVAEQGYNAMSRKDWMRIAVLRMWYGLRSCHWSSRSCGCQGLLSAANRRQARLDFIFLIRMQLRFNLTLFVSGFLVRLRLTSDSVIGSRERRMCLINSCFGSFCERKQIRMAFFSSPQRLLAGPSGPVAGSRESPRSRKGSFLRMNVWPTDVKVRAARPLGINEERREFPPRSDVSRMPSFCRSAPRA
jgi:hypothetical protein